MGGKLEILPASDQILVDRRLQNVAPATPIAGPTHATIDAMHTTGSGTTSTTNVIATYPRPISQIHGNQ